MSVEDEAKRAEEEKRAIRAVSYGHQFIRPILSLILS